MLHLAWELSLKPTLISHQVCPVMKTRVLLSAQIFNTNSKIQMLEPCRPANASTTANMSISNSAVMQVLSIQTLDNNI